MINKTYNLPDLINILRLYHNNQDIIFTNGCFDILHLGHLNFLYNCKQLGDVLIVGINTDKSIRQLKGVTRPINTLDYRVEFLSYLSFVDYIIVFDELTPINIISSLRPNILVKGGDYNIEEIIGYDIVNEYGTVLTIPFKYDYSTTKIINRILDDNT